MVLVPNPDWSDGIQGIAQMLAKKFGALAGIGIRTAINQVMSRRAPHTERHRTPVAGEEAGTDLVLVALRWTKLSPQLLAHGSLV